MLSDLAALIPATAILSAVLVVGLRPLGKALKLIDHPDEHRKFHEASIPLTGGVSLFSTLCIIFAASNITVPVPGFSDMVWETIGICFFALIVLHAIDDIIELHSLTRLAIDTLLALIICIFGMIRLTDLEDLFGFGTIWLGYFSIPMTIFCFVAASNAFNMADGIDGLCTSLGIISFLTTIGLVILHTGWNQPILSSLTIATIALVPIYAANVGWFGESRVVFLGDSGARLIGFIAATALVCVGFKNMIQPVTAFFPIAVPVCDCLVLMGWRIAHGRSPLSADRLHLHHLLLDLGYSQSHARHLILALAVSFSLAGFALEISQVPAWVISVFIVVSFWGFIGLRVWLYLRTKSATIS